MALRKKNMLSFLAQRGLTDKEIYEEMGRIYGKHIVIKALCSDGSIDYQNTTLKNIVKGQAILGLGYFAFRLLKKKF